MRNYLPLYVSIQCSSTILSHLLIYPVLCKHLLSLPCIFSGLSIMKLPFHTTEKSTGSSLILIPSYRYWRPESVKQRQKETEKRNTVEKRKKEEYFNGRSGNWNPREFLYSSWSNISFLCYSKLTSSQYLSWHTGTNPNKKMGQLETLSFLWFTPL